MNFIRLTDTDGQAIFINLDQVICLGQVEDDCTYITTVDGESYCVKDKVDSILYHFPPHYPAVKPGQ